MIVAIALGVTYAALAVAVYFLIISSMFDTSTKHFFRATDHYRANRTRAGDVEHEIAKKWQRRAKRWSPWA